MGILCKGKELCPKQRIHVEEKERRSLDPQGACGPVKDSNLLLEGSLCTIARFSKYKHRLSC